MRQARQMLQFAQTRHDARLMGEAHYLLGKLYRGAGDYRTARYWLLQALRHWEPLGASADLVKLYIQLGGNQGLLLRPHELLDYPHRALAVARQVRTAIRRTA